MASKLFLLKNWTRTLFIFIVLITVLFEFPVINLYLINIERKSQTYYRPKRVLIFGPKKNNVLLYLYIVKYVMMTSRSVDQSAER